MKVLDVLAVESSIYIEMSGFFFFFKWRETNGGKLELGILNNTGAFSEYSLDLSER